MSEIHVLTRDGELLGYDQQQEGGSALTSPEVPYQLAFEMTRGCH